MMLAAKISGLPETVGGKGIRITERKEVKGIALARYYPKRLKRKHLFDEFSRDLWRFKKHYDGALIDKLSKSLAEMIRATGLTVSKSFLAQMLARDYFRKE